jgi:hypothetical protein
MKRFFKYLFLFIVLVVCFFYIHSFYRSFRTPGQSYAGALDPLDNFGTRLRDHLKEHVAALSQQIGERNLNHYDRLEAAATYIRQYLEQQEYRVEEQDFTVQGKTCRNLYAVLEGSDKAKPVLVIGAHYDSVAGSPGADDNGSGVAAVLELARIMKNEPIARSIVFAFFTNEEPPYSQTDSMGSLQLARYFKLQHLPIAGMISVETIGYYSTQPGSQKYPAGIGSFYPNTGNFIGFVGNLGSRTFLHQAIAAFRASAHFPSEGAAVPKFVKGVSWSDHWSFWRIGVPAIMVTDTAPFRYPYYHTANDTPDHLDYDRMARVVVGLKHVLQELAQ